MERHDESNSNELSCTSRRTFCAELLTTTGLLLAAPNIAEGMTTQDTMIAYPPRKIEGAELLLPGSSLYFNYPTRNDPAVLLRLSDTEFRAYSRRCSHAGCSVDYDDRSRCLMCPCHRGAFETRAGRVMFGPPRRSLEEIILEVRAGGHLWAVGKNLGNTEIITQNLRGGD
jgi:Rieske Fe-S protein